MTTLREIAQRVRDNKDNREAQREVLKGRVIELAKAQLEELLADPFYEEVSLEIEHDHDGEIHIEITGSPGTSIAWEEMRRVFGEAKVSISPETIEELGAEAEEASAPETSQERGDRYNEQVLAQESMLRASKEAAEKYAAEHGGEVFFSTTMGVYGVKLTVVAGPGDVSITVEGVECPTPDECAEAGAHICKIPARASTGGSTGDGGGV